MTAARTYLIFTAAHGLVIDARFDVVPGLEEDGALSHGEILEALGRGDSGISRRRWCRRARSAAAEAEVAIEDCDRVGSGDAGAGEQDMAGVSVCTRGVRRRTRAAGTLLSASATRRSKRKLRGRTIAVSTFRELRRNDALLASAYFSDIDRVEAAGFLREYVWSYLHHASWDARSPRI